jgi:hypothetical protein
MLNAEIDLRSWPWVIYMVRTRRSLQLEEELRKVRPALPAKVGELQVTWSQKDPVRAQAPSVKISYEPRRES